MKARTWAVSGLASVLLIGVSAAAPGVQKTMHDLALVRRSISRDSPESRSYRIAMKPEPEHPGRGLGGSIRLDTTRDNKLGISIDMPGQGRMFLAVEMLPKGANSEHGLIRISGTRSSDGKPHSIDCSSLSVSFPNESGPTGYSGQWTPESEIQWEVDRIINEIENIGNR